jgi:hypothetical protein
MKPRHGINRVGKEWASTWTTPEATAYAMQQALIPQLCAAVTLELVDTASLD